MEVAHCWPPLREATIVATRRQAGQECPASFGLPVRRRFFDRRVAFTLANGGRSLLAAFLREATLIAPMPASRAGEPRLQ